MPSRRATSIVACALSLGACAAPPPPVVKPPPADVITPAPPRAEAPAPPDDPPLAREEAIARGRELVEAWNQVRYDADAKPGWLRDHALDETAVRRLLEAVARPCLAERDREAEACKDLKSDASDAGKSAEVLAEILGPLSDAAAPGKRSVRLLSRLDARGLWRAGLAVKEVLERRARAHVGTCAPPSAAEIAAARASLADFAILDPAAKGAPAARWPAAAELDDLAYFYAAIAASGPPVGGSAEDRKAQPLPADHPDHATRKDLRAEAESALFDGDLERHVRAAEAYLRTLGYPGPMRVAEEGDMRWGGSGASFLLREAARSAEILGRYDLAEALDRRALPGGGACGTSTASYRDEQIEGVIRAAEQQRGCRAVVAERLFAVASDRHALYGPERLADAGFDVPRLYAGALWTLGRDDAAALTTALQSLPDRASEAVARVGRLGPEAWSTRVRALPGYADTARGAAFDRLLSIAERGPRDQRVAAIEIIGQLAEDRGSDPCAKGRIGLGWGYGSSSRPRRVQTVMKRCETRLDDKRITKLVQQVTALAADPDPAVREAVASTLGRLGVPAGRPALLKLARDRFDGGGQVCTSRDGGPSVCEPNLPVMRAAKAGLEAIAAAEKHRAEQRAAQAKAKRD